MFSTRKIGNENATSLQKFELPTAFQVGCRRSEACRGLLVFNNACLILENTKLAMN
jgi:hypothetical protein